ncbi:MAG: nucleotidyltransferase domain-containing protein [Cyclobacteriaceae bacterium]
MDIVKDQIQQVKDLCRKHRVESLYLFGSAVSGDLMADSDIDFLVKFQSFDLKLYFKNYMSLKKQLDNLFKRDIDLLEEQTLKNPCLIRSIDQSKQLIYG